MLLADIIKRKTRDKSMQAAKYSKPTLCGIYAARYLHEKKFCYYNEIVTTIEH